MSTVREYQASAPVLYRRARQRTRRFLLVWITGLSSFIAATIALWKLVSTDPAGIFFDRANAVKVSPLSSSLVSLGQIPKGFTARFIFATRARYAPIPLPRVQPRFTALKSRGAGGGGRAGEDDKNLTIIMGVRNARERRSDITIEIARF